MHYSSLSLSEEAVQYHVGFYDQPLAHFYGDSQCTFHQHCIYWNCFSLDNHDNMWVTEAGDLSAKYIIHADVRSCKNIPGKLPTLITSCLNACVHTGVSSIAFPALSKGKLYTAI